MNTVLLDTDVFSYLTKSNDTRAELYRPHVQGKTLAISFITVGEVYFGAAKKKWSGATLDRFVERLKAVIIVPYDLELCRTYGKLKALLREAGLVASDNDLWISACAVRHSIPLITHNRRHFARVPGLQVISETAL